MVQSPSWVANWFAASQEIPRISRNPKVHYHTHKSLYRRLRLQFIVLLMMGAVTPETYRVTLQ